MVNDRQVREGGGRGRAPRCARVVAVLLGLLAMAQAWACHDNGHVRLNRPVALTAAEHAEFAAMAPLSVLAVDAPPMVRHDPRSGDYVGIGVDVWCFVANRIGLRYDFVEGQGQTVADRIGQVQAGTADVFLSLSVDPERARYGLFTLPYYETYYAIIARKGARLPVHGLSDLGEFRVGVIKGVAFEPILHEFVGASRLVTFDRTDSDALFQALRQNQVDVAVFNKSIFEEKRFQHEYFDLEVVHTLRDMPRAYGFYFHASPANEHLVAVFNRYLAAIDVSQAVLAYEDGEREFIERYVLRRSQRLYWQAGIAVALVLAAVFLVALHRYRRLMRLVLERNRRIVRQQRALVASHRELEKLSQTDGLTGLANRREFDHALLREHARQQRTKTALSLLMIDIDYFKCVNDHYGHAVGDDYLRAVARALTASVGRATDIVARFGGEEFVCLLPNTSAVDARAMAERIRDNLAQVALPSAAAPHPVLTLSIGVATLVGGDASAQDLLVAADTQLYTAKRAGRDRVASVVLDATQ